MIGRSRECDIQLADPNVSRKHAECARRARLTGSSTSSRRTASRSTGGARSGRSSRTVTRSRSARPSSSSGDFRDRCRLRPDRRGSCSSSRSRFLVLLYLFIWRIVRIASREVRTAAAATACSSRPQQARELRLAAGEEDGLLVVVKSPALDEGSEVPLERRAAHDRPGRRRTTSRSTATSFASARARAVRAARATAYGSRTSARRTGRTSTASSSNGRERLEPGDIVRVGETDLRFER